MAAILAQGHLFVHRALVGRRVFVVRGRGAVAAISGRGGRNGPLFSIGPAIGVLSWRRKDGLVNSVSTDVPYTPRVCSQKSDRVSYAERQRQQQQGGSKR